VRNAIVFVVSTGVGGGIVSDGRLVAGGSGNAGHLGQILVADVDGEPAASTLEQRASGPHTVAWARAQGWAGTTGEELAVSYRAGETWRSRRSHGPRTRWASASRARRPCWISSWRSSAAGSRSWRTTIRTASNASFATAPSTPTPGG
jgi:hypothetical protein